MKSRNLNLLLLLGIAALVRTAEAQPVTVTGTGSPDIDVQAVQAAVDQGGQVVLAGHFSFDQPATTPNGSIYSRMITVSKDVMISGVRDASGAYTTIQGGGWPFFIDAINSQVTIEKLYFVGPSGGAV